MQSHTELREGGTICIGSRENINYGICGRCMKCCTALRINSAGCGGGLMLFVNMLRHIYYIYACCVLHGRQYRTWLRVLLIVSIGRGRNEGVPVAICLVYTGTTSPWYLYGYILV